MGKCGWVGNVANTADDVSSILLSLLSSPFSTPSYSGNATPLKRSCSRSRSAASPPCASSGRIVYAQPKDRGRGGRGIDGLGADGVDIDGCSVPIHCCWTTDFTFRAGVEEFSSLVLPMGDVLVLWLVIRRGYMRCSSDAGCVSRDDLDVGR